MNKLNGLLSSINIGMGSGQQVQLEAAQQTTAGLSGVVVNHAGTFIAGRLLQSEPHGEGAKAETFSMYQDTPPVGYEDRKKPSTPPHALAHVIGAFADDPQWDEFVAEMAKSRREQDQAYAEAE